MTRINVGIEPSELCDQHLQAEYRELPRLFNKVSKNKAPIRFKLGKGHNLWCQERQGLLHDRYIAIIKEKEYRGFKSKYQSPPPETKNGKRPSEAELKRARSILLERIRERMDSMWDSSDPKNWPRWTKRTDNISNRR